MSDPERLRTIDLAALREDVYSYVSAEADNEKALHALVRIRIHLLEGQIFRLDATQPARQFLTKLWEAVQVAAIGPPLPDWLAQQIIGWTESAIRANTRSTPATAPTTPPGRRNRGDSTKARAAALVLVNDHPEWPDAKIAKAAGLSPSQLSRDQTYQKAAALARQPKKRPAAGFRTQAGDMDAWDHD